MRRQRGEEAKRGGARGRTFQKRKRGEEARRGGEARGRGARSEERGPRAEGWGARSEGRGARSKGRGRGARSKERGARGEEQGGGGADQSAHLDPNERDIRMLDGEGEQLSCIAIPYPQNSGRIAQIEQRSDQSHATCAERHRRVWRTVPNLPCKGCNIVRSVAEGSVGSIVLGVHRSGSPTVQVTSSHFG